MIRINVNHGGYTWLFEYDGKLGLTLIGYELIIMPLKLSLEMRDAESLFVAAEAEAKRELLRYIREGLRCHYTLRHEALENQKQMLLEISEGNPGAISALCELVRCGDKNDKISEVGEYLKMLKRLGVVGTDAYVLFNDICDRDSKKMFIVLWAVHNDHFDAVPFSLACSKQDYSGRDIIPVDALVELFNNEVEISFNRL